MKRVLPNDKKLKKSVSSIKVDGNLKTDKNAIAKVACEQALHLGDIVLSCARGTREETRMRGTGERKESLQRSHIHFHFHPRKPWDTAKRVNCHRKSASD